MPLQRSIISRTIGLPEAAEFVGRWSTWGIISLIVEGFFVALFLSVVTLRGRK